MFQLHRSFERVIGSPGVPSPYFENRNLEDGRKILLKGLVGGGLTLITWQTPNLAHSSQKANSKRVQPDSFFLNWIISDVPSNSLNSVCGFTLTEQKPCAYHVLVPSGYQDGQGSSCSQGTSWSLDLRGLPKRRAKRLPSLLIRPQACRWGGKGPIPSPIKGRDQMVPFSPSLLDQHVGRCPIPLIWSPTFSVPALSILVYTEFPHYMIAAYASSFDTYFSNFRIYCWPVWIVDFTGSLQASATLALISPTATLRHLRHEGPSPLPSASDTTLLYAPLCQLSFLKCS